MCGKQSIFMYSPFDFLCMAFELMSTLLYIFLISKMIYSGLPLFRSGFFLIFIACSFSDIASGFVHAPMRHIVFNMEESLKLGAKTYSILYKILYWLSTQTLTSHVIFSLLLSANRCTAVGWPSRHSKIWTTRNTLMLIVAVYTVLALAYADILWSRDAAIVDDNGNTVFIDLDKALLSRVHLCGAAIMAIRSVLCLIMSIYTLRKLMQMASATRTAISDTERKLCFHAIILFVGSLIMLAQQITMGYAASTNDLNLALWVANQFPWINDVVVYTNLYSIIVCSSHVRSLFGKWKLKPITEKESVTKTAHPNVFVKR